MSTTDLRDAGGAPQFTTHPQLSTTLEQSAVDLVWVPVVVLITLCLLADLGLAAFAIVSIGSTGGRWALALPSLVLLLPLGLIVGTWLRLRSISRPLVISPAGLGFETHQGVVALPWEAVTVIGVDRMAFGQQLTVRPARRAGPNAPGITSTIRPSGWRVIRRSGLRLSLRAVDQSPEQIVAAIAELSGGRHRPTVG